MIYDAFISYSRNDKRDVQLLVKALEDAGVRLFWDAMIRPAASWDTVLEQALKQSHYTLLCITESGVRSDFVGAEMRWSEGKLIPVYLEDVNLPLIWEAKIGRLQRVDLSQCQHYPSDGAFKQLCDLLLGSKSRHSERKFNETLEPQARRLIENSARGDLALAMALSVLGGASIDEVRQLARDFEHRLPDFGSANESNSGLRPESLRKRLDRIGAKTFEKSDSRLGVREDCVRFRDPGLGHEILALTWSDYDMLWEPILAWIKDWSAQSPLWIRERLALNIGVLAQDEKRFGSLWRNVLKPMLFSNARGRTQSQRDRFAVADAALSIAAIRPSRRANVEMILNQMIEEQEVSDNQLKVEAEKVDTSTSNEDQEGIKSNGHDVVSPLAPRPKPSPTDPGVQDKKQPEQGEGSQQSVGGSLLDEFTSGNEHVRMQLVARLAFGYTGARYPDLAVKALRRLAERGRVGTFYRMLGGPFSEKMASSKSLGDDSLWDPIDILLSLLQWVDEVEDDEEKSLPLMIFIFGLKDLALSNDSDDSLSLTAIMLSKRGIKALKKGLLMGLSLRETRDAFTEQLCQWRDEQSINPVYPDPVLALVCLLLYGCKTDKDRKRIRFMFRNHYSSAQIADLSKQAPALTRSKS